jgi:hypothetical protein
MRLLRLDAETTFALSAAGRIERENDPDLSPGPRLFFAGCPDGNIVHLRHDVGEATAGRVLDILSDQPPWSEPDARPAHLDEVIALVAEEAPVKTINRSVIHHLPRNLACGSARIVSGDNEEGAAMLARFAADCMPRSLFEAGFVGVGDFWAPWCAALEGDEIAAMAFAARTGAAGSAIGIYTFEGFRGRGLGAAVTAAWSRLPSLAGRELFYSALAANASSRRVIERLGLPRLGAGLRIS